MIAKNFNDFTEKVVSAEQTVLNSDIGQQLTNQLLQMKLEQNPNMTAEEWSKTKQEFMVFIFHEIIKSKPELMQEMGSHLYDKLRSNPT